jgi:hypothetical protein
MGPEKPRRRWVIGGRSRRVLVVAGVCVLLAVGATVAAVRLNAPANPALAKLVTEVTTVPVGEAVPLPAPTVIAGTTVPVSGDPDTQSPPNSSGSASVLLIDPWSFPAVAGPLLTADGKPEVLYVDNGYCPYCIAENWSLIIALSRFGEFSGLSTSRSLAFEDVPPVDGWTFYGSSYVSRYLTFVPVETRSNVLVSPKANPDTATSYRVLQRLTPAEEAVFIRLDPQRQTPFLDFGGKAWLTGSDFSPYDLADMTWSQIAAGLRNPRTQVGMTLIVEADTLTAEICRLTDDRPAAACPR